MCWYNARMENDRKKPYEPTGFGQRLAALRADSGLSNRELGIRAGIHPNALAKIERGIVEPGWPIVLKLAAALDVNVSEFAPSGHKGRTAEQLKLEKIARNAAKDAGFELKEPKRQRKATRRPSSAP